MPQRKQGSSPVSLVWPGRGEQPPSEAPAELKINAEVYPPGSNPPLQPSPDRLVLSDNLTAMTWLLAELEGKIDLIYADPPFRTEKSYSVRIGEAEDSRVPSEWLLTHGYSDRWLDRGSYLDMLYTRLQLMHRLLSPSGTLYLHLDWHEAPYARVLLDEVFGPERILNEIIWIYHGPSPIRSAFKRKHDTILVYTKSDHYTFNVDAVRVEYDPTTVRTFASSSRAGFGKIPDLARGKVPEDWWYFPVVARLHKERTGYPTQKPEGLLGRIIQASSNPGDLVADFFCGSGTTAVVCSRLGRRWLACDSASLAVQTTYRRLLLQPGPKPFAFWTSPGQAPVQHPIVPMVVHRSGKSVTVSMAPQETVDRAAEDWFRQLVMWEVDWDYDGQVFRSRSQAVRQWRDGELLAHLDHQYPSLQPQRLAVRAADREGRWYLAEQVLA